MGMWIVFVFAAAALTMMVFMLHKSRNMGRHLARLVAEKTSTLTAIFNATPDLILCKDLESRVTECNSAVENYFDLTRQDIIGKDDAAAFGMPLETVKQYVALDKQIFKSKQAVTVEESIPTSNGQMQLFETVKSPLIQDGAVTGLVAMSRDITSRKAVEEEAKSASKAKSRFVANMSHEMRTPMNVIVGLTDLMLEDEGTPAYLKEMLKKVSTAGGTLMGLINNVLDISKIEAGKLELMPVQYDTASLINDIVTLNMIRIEDKPITFTLHIDEYLPCMIVGDDLRVKQVLNNLLSNAFKYTKEGSVTLDVGFRFSHGDVWLTFRISDTGIGIREEDLAQLFTDYNQVDALANREIEGTGLGLSITKKIVEQMDGEIAVESVYGKGTTFSVTIRQTFATDKPIGKETAEHLRRFRYSDKKKHPHEKLTRPNLSYAHVLVVDDFPTNLEVAAGLLRKYKMRVECVTSGKEAVDRIAAGDDLYDAIFMDHMMPEMDGMEATAAIRSLGSQYAETVPIIALTANAVAGNEKMFLENGFNAFLPKPINIMILDAVVERWVRDKAKESNAQCTMHNV